MLTGSYKCKSVNEDTLIHDSCSASLLHRAGSPWESQTKRKLVLSIPIVGPYTKHPFLQLLNSTADSNQGFVGDLSMYIVHRCTYI